MRTGLGWNSVRALASLVVCVAAGATTLQKLSLDDMIQQSTGIVRARVAGSRTALRGTNIYTYYRLNVLETAKASPAAGKELEIAVLGGTLNGMRQVGIGSPELAEGAEYVVFYWTGKSGLTQIIGLSQGLFAASRDAAGKLRLAQAASKDVMVDQRGREVSADAMTMAWTDLRARIRRDLSGEAQ